MLDSPLHQANLVILEHLIVRLHRIALLQKKSKLRDAREEQIMSVAKEANRIARKQFRIDLIAINYRCYRHDYRYYRSKSRYQMFHFLGIEHFQKPLTIQSSGRAAARH